MIKLVIWDLDDTLWSGTLAEGDTIVFNTKIIDFIKKSEALGVVHSICSKNNFANVRTLLEKYDMWKYFIFPSIDFSPKGLRVQQIIQNCNLREVNVAFVDDNSINLAEAKYYLPGLNTFLSSDELIDQFEFPNGVSRTAQYQILELKAVDKNNLDFLKDSDIHVAIGSNKVGMLFIDRISELVNRSNLLNYSHSRINNVEKISHVHYTKLPVFVWDKYGYYGLVGFIGMYSQKNTIEHFVFSCRIMNMGVEQACKKYLETTLGIKFWYTIPSMNTDFITVHASDDSEAVMDLIIKQEPRAAILKNARAEILVNCVSSTFWDLSGRHADINWESIPTMPFGLATTFSSYNVLLKKTDLTNRPPLLIYGGFNEYLFSRLGYWQDGVDNQCIEQAVDSVAEYVRSTDRRMLVMLPTHNSSDSRFDTLDNAWEKNVDNKYLYAIRMPIEMEDFRHYTRETVAKTGKLILEWLAMFNKDN